MIRAIGEITIAVIQRAADCFMSEDPRVDPEFWENLYGPYGPGEEDIGMLDWGNPDLWEGDY